MTRARWGLVALGLAFFGYTASAARLGFSPYDDAVFTYGGLAMAHGRVPYEDFWTLYNPGQFALIGAFFRYVSESVLAFRLFESAIVAASGLLVWDLCRRIYSKRVGVVASSFFVLWLGAGSALYPFHENHTLTSLFLLLASADLLVIAVPAGRIRLIAAAGACAGACFVIRQDAALYVLLPELFAFVVWRAVHGTAWRTTLRRAGAYVAGAAAPIALMLAWVLRIDAAGWWRQAVLFPVTDNPGLREIPYTYSPLNFNGSGAMEVTTNLATSAREGFFYFLPFVVALVACVLVIASLRRKVEMPATDLWGFALVTLLLAASLDYSRVRSDFEHIFPSVLLSFVVVPGIVAAIARGVTTALPRRAIAGVGLLVALFALFIPLAARLRAAQGLREGVRLTSGPLAGIVVDNRDNGGSSNWLEVQAAADYVRERTSSDEPLFVTTPRNDRLFTSYPAFYVLADRPAGTLHAELYPGVTTTERTQQTIISDLEESGVRYVVRWPSGDQGCVEPNLACRPHAPGSDMLDLYLSDEYRRAASFGAVEILKKTT